MRSEKLVTGGLAAALTTLFPFIVSCGPASDDAIGTAHLKVTMTRITFPLSITSSTQHLPMPGGLLALPSGDAIADARAREVELLHIRRYLGYRLLATTKEANGDIVDWIDGSTIPGSDASPPPIASGPPGFVSSLGGAPKPLSGGPSGSIPFIRSALSSYVSGESGANSLDEFIVNQKFGQPAGQTRLYGGYSNATVNRGVVSNLNNLFTTNTIESGTFALFENMALCWGANPSTDLEFVGAVISRDRANFGDSTVRFQTEFSTAGNATGNNVGGWDGLVTGLVPAAGRIYAPGMAISPSISALSTIGGNQYDVRVDTTRATDGNWWVAVAGSWVGYYPASFFNLIVPNACQMDWYGEVFDPTPTDWTANDMGSGNFASTGWQQSGYIRDPWYVDPFGNYIWANNTTSGAVGPADSACYTTGAFIASSSPWDRYFFLGGPGGDAPGCN